MNPFDVLSLLGGFGGLFLHDNSQQAYLDAMRKAYQMFYSPQAIGTATRGFYGQNISSPAFAQQQAQAIGAAQNMGGYIPQNSNMGNIAQAFKGGYLGRSIGSLYGNAWNSALQNAYQSAQGTTGMQMPQQQFGFPQQYGALLQTLSQLGNIYGGRTQNQQYYGGGYNPNPMVQLDYRTLRK